MGTRRQEILDRCALLFKESQILLGESVEIIFGSFGDTRACGDPMEVCQPGAGPELDTYLKALNMNAGGGGNVHESSDLSLFYSLMQVDTSSAKQVFCFILTDEMAYETLDEADVQTNLGLRLNEFRKTSDVAKAMLRRMNVYTILSSYCNNPRAFETDEIRKSWEEILGDPGRVVPLDDARRTVDVLLGVISKVTGQFNLFSQKLSARQSGTQYGAVNISTVHQSLANVSGAPQAPVPSKANPAKSLILGSGVLKGAATVTAPPVTPSTANPAKSLILGSGVLKGTSTDK
jgi:hypothetical protein